MESVKAARDTNLGSFIHARVSPGEDYANVSNKQNILIFNQYFYGELFSQLRWQIIDRLFFLWQVLQKTNTFQKLYVSL